ncbi:MAG: cell envelope integrity protein TolA [Cycloclasticus sp.]
MIGIFKKHPLAVVLSVTFHLLLVAFFVFGIDFTDDEIHSKPPVNIVKATVIDESKIKAAAEELKKLEKKKKLQDKKRVDDLRKKRLAEEKKIADLKKKKASQEKKLAQQKADEAARQAKLKKQKSLAKKKKAEAAKKKKLAQAKELKQRLAREKAEKIKAAAEAKAAQEQAEREQAEREQAEREQDLREQAALEEQQMRAQVAVASYTDLIRQKVERNWIQPPGDIMGLNCVVRVRLIPGGDVIDAQVIKSSGNTFFDRSVERATRKAAPLPLPSDPSMFNYFRTLEFYFRPGG